MSSGTNVRCPETESERIPKEDRTFACTLASASYSWTVDSNSSPSSCAFCMALSAKSFAEMDGCSSSNDLQSELRLESSLLLPNTAFLAWTARHLYFVFWKDLSCLASTPSAAEVDTRALLCSHEATAGADSGVASWPAPDAGVAKLSCGSATASADFWTAALALCLAFGKPPPMGLAPSSRLAVNMRPMIPAASAEMPP
mmetsp:Transcript_159571/g.291084  ORF Transcript_159571/g.291084 Transcript_159571/m.291084 type:complete len:200 (-) Transcript_159571:8-607(-)